MLERSPLSLQRPTGCIALSDGCIFWGYGIGVDVDALADGRGTVIIAGVMEHIEEAGVHSGDSACSIPPYSLSNEIIKK